MKAGIELLIKPNRRAVIDLNAISCLFTSPGSDCNTVAPPESPITVLMSNGNEFETYGISVVQILIAMKTYGKSDGWLPLP